MTASSYNYYYYLYYVHETVQHNMHIIQGIRYRGKYKMCQKVVSLEKLTP